ncbi:MAG TPA: hypothetical protein PLN56_06440 [Methanoregulaceae archaeon]|mgnify:CR=1 FL=1|nr:MAG: hypothetical protein IPI71_09710 [Methanolinea sp.]HON81877.1 hypothetical protein [Methanoregulaceae archaeon]HPD10616.1 hypothetical protein [Methanoregulaceae archaeon]HRT15748.1 hypothetical protein [Methanoregulaceae archaeon]HRU31262.1 hypothetical protein [Methanoregulaceae archaeon]
MGDFVQQSITKTAVRELASPIADIAAFNNLVSGVISGNPWGCTAYDVAGVPQAPVAKSREGYTARIEYENAEAKVVGSVTARAPTVAAFNAAVTAIAADTALATAIGGDAIHVSDEDSFSATLKCHDANGEIYYVAFGREQVRVTSYSDDAILATIETWADTKPELA